MLSWVLREGRGMVAHELLPGIDTLLFLIHSVGQKRQLEEVEDAIPAVDRSCCRHITGDVSPRRDGVCHLSLFLYSVRVSMMSVYPLTFSWAGLSVLGTWVYSSGSHPAGALRPVGDR